MNKLNSITETRNRMSLQDDAWRDTCEQFLASVPTHLQERVEWALHNLHSGGTGLRNWVSAIAWRGGKLPEHVPSEIIDVYMCDEEAKPLYDCESCGMAIPVRASRTATIEDEPEYVYFKACPACGGRTGLYLYFSRQYQPSGDFNSTRIGKPK